MVTFASICGSVIINLLSRRFDTVKLYYYTNLVLAALAVAMWFLPTGQAYQTLWLVVILGNGIILGFTLPLHFSLMAFSDDYGEWKTGVRSSGMNFAFNLFFIKLAWASSAGIISLCLSTWPISRAPETKRHHRWRDRLNGNPAARPVPSAAGLFDPRLQAQQSDDGAHCQRPAHASRSALRSPSCLLWKSICTN
jgi:hypothetical protein